MSSLQSAMRGRVIEPSAPDYDDVRRIWNGAVDRRPAVIACCADTSDVIACIRHARAHDMEVSVRGGGHGVAGQSLCDNGLVIDLAGLKDVTVRAGRVEAGAGLLNGEFDAATLASGQATTAGIVSHTGLAGLALGGGIGWLMRAHAATCDNIIGAELVDATGRVIEVDETHELMWALRGAGANFGVVTRFDLRLHPVGPEVLAGVLLFPAERAEDVLRAYRDIIATAPRELTTVVVLRHAPPQPWVPLELRGRPVLMIAACWCGSPDAGERCIAPLRALHPIADTVTGKPYTEHQQLFDAGVPHGLQYYWRSDYVAALDDAMISALLAHAWMMASPRSYTIIFQLGGALAEVDPSSAVFAGRTGFAININGVWTARGAPDDDAAWVRRQWQSIHPHSTGVYVNFLDNETPSRVAAAYGAAAVRLGELKWRYDPDNVFHNNHNVTPILSVPTEMSEHA
jgi:UDP-N-acetylenolpyruvoylglucosamine reductase